MRRRLASLLPILPLTVLTAAPASRASTQASYPSAAAQEIATSASGWTATTAHSGVCVIPGVTCPTVTATHQPSGGAAGAGDGYLRASVTTLTGLLSSGAATWTSPSFTPGDTADAAWLHLMRSADVATLLSVGGNATMSVTLVDTGTTSRTSLVTSAPIAAGGWSAVDAAVPAGALIAGHTYAIELQVSFATPVSVAVAGSVGFDQISIGAARLTPPSGLATPTIQTDLLGTRLTGAVDPGGLTTTIHADLGLTTAYGATIGPVTVGGSGSVPYVLPLVGLVPGQTYHVRVRASNADGTVDGSDVSFTAPAAPSDAAPAVTGPDASRTRTVTFDRAGDVLSALIEIVDHGAVVGSVAVPSGDHADITLPDADGDYGIRIVRTSLGGSTTSPQTASTLDRVAPSTAGVALALTPTLSSDRARIATFVRPTDAISVHAELLDAADHAVATPGTVTGSHLDLLLPATDGLYRLRLTLTDPAGNAATVISTPVELDALPPSPPPAPSVTGPTASRTRSVWFDRAPDAAWAMVELLDAGAHVIGSTLLLTGDTTDILLPDGDGAYAVRVRQADAAGNESASESQAMALDRSAPADPSPTSPTAPSPTPAATLPATPISVVAAGESASEGPADGEMPAPTGMAPGGDALGLGNGATDWAAIDSADGMLPGRTVDDGPAEGRAGTPGYALASCAAEGVALTRIASSGAMTRVTGVTRWAAGTPVEVIRDGGPVVGHAAVHDDGTFSAVMPSAALGSSTGAVRLYAKSATIRSRAVRTERDNDLARLSRRGRTLTLVGTLAPQFRKASTQLTALGGRDVAGCRHGQPLKLVASTRLNVKTGRYVLRVRVPAGSGPVIARVRAEHRAAGKTYSAFAVR